MERSEIKTEVDHILESGANDIRFIELIERLLVKERELAVEKALEVASKKICYYETPVKLFEGKQSILSLRNEIIEQLKCGK